MSQDCETAPLSWFVCHVFFSPPKPWNGSPRPGTVGNSNWAFCRELRTRISCTSRYVRFGFAWSISAMTPETIGVEAEVPFIREV